MHVLKIFKMVVLCSTFGHADAGCWTDATPNSDGHADIPGGTVEVPNVRRHPAQRLDALRLMRCPRLLARPSAVCRVLADGVRRLHEPYFCDNP
jgi:hypothetical protein